MPREDIEFKTYDNVVLRGWFYKSDARQAAADKLPCLVISHGWTCLKEMGLDLYAEYFTSKLLVNCLVYDQRGFGASDNAPGQPRSEVLSPVQISDLQDAITYAQSRSDVDKEKIALWGYSYSGGHSINVAAIDRRVKAVVVIAPFVDGWGQWHRFIRPDFVAVMNNTFQEDRLNRAAGGKPATMPVADADPTKPAGIPGLESYEFFSKWEGKVPWKNEITVRSAEDVRANDATARVAYVSPTPLLMTLADKDLAVPTSFQLQVYEKALQPKELQMLTGGHFIFFDSPNFDVVVKRQTEFLASNFCQKMQ